TRPAHASFQDAQRGEQRRLPAAFARPTLTPAPTEGPRRPTLCQRLPRGSPILAECQEQSAEICLRQSTSPSGAIAPGQSATYQLIAHNSGRGDAADVRLTLPFAADAQAPLDAAFSASGAWASAVLTDAIELRLASLKRGQTITATLRLRTSPEARIGRELATRARFRWG